MMAETDYRYSVTLKHDDSFRKCRIRAVQGQKGEIRARMGKDESHEVLNVNSARFARWMVHGTSLKNAREI